ncbi:hypothetical protein GH810_12785 [Acetobacterium paludosum]|uniref:Heavy-metal chelation domain-containing protein n=1 Tax=Acetobacterium paludosum TaxID=52693 RepID=A0A923KX58_9FIRM|nr:DUF364 domain-containing protein [Acetobacterium paludosum]MBC3889190.1 hypothetical protein [Acetobacterium paludosum]
MVSNPWRLYDCLLESLPDEAVVESCMIGPIWTVVCTSVGTGMAMTPPDAPQANRLAGTIAGTPLRELAELVKSWDFGEAAIGLAAINAWYNQPERVQSKRCRSKENGSMFGEFETLMTGKKVAVIGHFPGVEPLRPICELSVLERICQTGDYPDPACEYLLPDQDFVFITATALENKTMPRLLQLCQKPFTVIWGPSTPLTNVLFEFGVDALIGSLISSTADVIRIAGEGGIATRLRPYMESRLWLSDEGKS